VFPSQCGIYLIFFTIQREFWWGNPRERAHWGDLGVDGMKWDVRVWTGFGWLRIETGGGKL
jgi:hypothetical protein